MLQISTYVTVYHGNGTRTVIPLYHDQVINGVINVQGPVQQEECEADDDYRDKRVILVVNPHAEVNNEEIPYG